MSGKMKDWRGGACRKRGGNNGSHTETIGMGLTRGLTAEYYRQRETEAKAKKLGRAGAEQKGDRKRIAPKSQRHTDEQVMAAIRERRAGVSFQVLAEKYDTNPDVVRNWCNGVNRGHLLDRVDREG